MNPEVLILTSVYDFSADLVSLRLEAAGVPFLRISREHTKEYRFWLDPTRPRLNITLANDPRHEWVVGSSLKSVWFRMPVFLRNTPPVVLSIEEQLSRSQWMAFFRALSVFDQAAWMNWPQATYLAESKPYQLLAASRCGMRVPSSLVANMNTSQSRVHGKGMVLKSLDTILLREAGEYLFTYSICGTDDAYTDEELASAPFIVQDYVRDNVDVRVTVIGEAISAIRILSNGSPIKGDWRTTPRDSLEYEDIALPEKVASSCLKLTHELGLSFSAIDLLETDSDFFFLEINPTGEWGWLNSDKRRFDVLIADWLANPPTRAARQRMQFGK